MPNKPLSAEDSLRVFLVVYLYEAVGKHQDRPLAWATSLKGVSEEEAEVPKMDKPSWQSPFPFLAFLLRPVFPSIFGSPLLSRVFSPLTTLLLPNLISLHSFSRSLISL